MSARTQCPPPLSTALRRWNNYFPRCVLVRWKPSLMQISLASKGDPICTQVSICRAKTKHGVIKMLANLINNLLQVYKQRKSLAIVPFPRHSNEWWRDEIFKRRLRCIQCSPIIKLPSVLIPSNRFLRLYYRWSISFSFNSHALETTFDNYLLLIKFTCRGNTWRDKNPIVSTMMLFPRATESLQICKWRIY